MQFEFVLTRIKIDTFGRPHRQMNCPGSVVQRSVIPSLTKKYRHIFYFYQTAKRCTVGNE